LKVAKDNFLKALEIYPIIPAQINLAKAYLNENNFAQAETICNKGLQYEWPETKIDFLKILCQCKRLQNDNDAAINRTLKPEFVKTLENEYQKLTPRYKIILILEDLGKSIDEIQQIMSFGESSYRSAKSRINAQKK